MSETRTIHFNALPEATRERLVKCLSGQGSPEAIIREPSSPGGSIFWWMVLGMLAASTLVFLVTVEIGELYGSMTIQDWPFALGYVAGFFVLFYSLLAVVRRVVIKRTYPFQTGRFLFPLDYIEANSELLKITPMRSLVDFQGVHHHTNGSYTHTLLNFDFGGGHRQSFSIASKARATEILESLGNQQRMIRESVERQQYDAIAALDPLIEARLGKDWESLGPEAPPGPKGVGAHLAGRVPGVLRLASIPALLLGLAFGPAAWAGRNLASDELRFEKAKDRDTEQDYQGYLYMGWRHVDEVRDVLMPKAAFNEAKAKGTVSAARDFLKSYPKAGYQKKARKHISKLYDNAYKEFKKQASTQNKALLPFMKEMLDYLEEHGTPDVAVRFRSPDEGALAEIDKTILGKGDVAPVSPYFTRERNERREEIIAVSLQRGFQSVFPEDILRLEKGEGLGKTSGKKVGEPTIEVRYKILPSEHIYKSDKNDRSFVGILVNFDVSMRIPKHKETLDFDLDVEPPERFTVSYSASSFLGPLDAGGPSDGQVYDVMAALAFEQLSTKMRTVFFREDSKAFEDSKIGE